MASLGLGQTEFFARPPVLPSERGQPTQSQSALHPSFRAAWPTESSSRHRGDLPLRNHEFAWGSRRECQNRV